MLKAFFGSNMSYLVRGLFPGYFKIITIFYYRKVREREMNYFLMFSELNAMSK